MSAADWLNLRVSRLAGDKKDPKTATKPGAPASEGRTTRERLNATLRQKEEALSPRVLRRTLEELRAIVDPHVSEVEGGRRAHGVALSAPRSSRTSRRQPSQSSQASAALE